MVLAKWKNSKAPVWESAPFLRVLLPFVAGIVIYDKVGVLRFNTITQFGIVFLFLALCLSALFFYKTNRKTGLQRAGSMLVAMLLSATGYSLSYLNDIRNSQNWFGNQQGKIFQARVTDQPQPRGELWRVPIAVTGIVGKSGIRSATGNAIIYLKRGRFPISEHKGDTILIRAQWVPISNAGNPCEFDYQKFCRRNNLFYRAFCSPGDVRITGRGRPEGQPIMERIHDWSYNRLSETLPDSVARGLIKAMVLGDEAGLDEGVLRSWSQAGIVHVIAISGGNVVIFLWVVFLFLAWLKNKKYRWVKYILSLPLVWIYVLVAGGSPSAIRAALMFTYFVSTIVIQKQRNPLNELFGAAFLMLLYCPMWLFAIGFQLSFVAVLSLIIFYEPVCAILPVSNIFLKKIWEMLAASIAAEILVAPMVVWYFHNFPLMFLVANLAAFTLMGIVQVSGMLLVGLSIFPVAAKPVGIVITVLIHAFNSFINWLNHFDPISFQRIPLSVGELICLYFMIAGFGLLWLRENRKGLYVGLAGLNVLVGLLCYDEWKCTEQQMLVVYNAGKNDYGEVICGKDISQVFADSIPTSKTEYLSFPAHVQWHSWRKEPASTISVQRDTLLFSSGKVLLVCKDPSIYQSPFPVDYLYVAGHQRVSPEHIDSVFSPVTTILKNPFSVKHRKSATGATRTKLHFLRGDGAFRMSRA